MLAKDLTGVTITAVAVFALLSVFSDTNLTSSSAAALLVLGLGGVVSVRRRYRHSAHGMSSTESLRLDVTWATLGSVFVAAMLVMLIPTEAALATAIGAGFIIISFGIALVTWLRSSNEQRRQQRSDVDPP